MRGRYNARTLPLRRLLPPSETALHGQLPVLLRRSRPRRVLGAGGARHLGRLSRRSAEPRKFDSSAAITKWRRRWRSMSIHRPLLDAGRKGDALPNEIPRAAPSLSDRRPTDWFRSAGRHNEQPWERQQHGAVRQCRVCINYGGAISGKISCLTSLSGVRNGRRPLPLNHSTTASAPPMSGW